MDYSGAGAPDFLVGLVRPECFRRCRLRAHPASAWRGTSPARRPAADPSARDRRVRRAQPRGPGLLAGGDRGCWLAWAYAPEWWTAAGPRLTAAAARAWPWIALVGVLSLAAWRYASRITSPAARQLRRPVRR